MTRILKAILAVALMMLVLIGLEAAFATYLPSDYVPRGLRAIRSIVETFADRPLGLPGWLFWTLAAAGSSVALLGVAIARQPRAPAKARARPRAMADGSATNRRRQLATPPPAEKSSVADEEPIDFTALYNLDRVIEPLPAWRMVETAPDDATSWLGGMPCAPAGFEWPLSDTGRPMLFIAQIDLAGVSVAGLPPEGSLLFFVGAPGSDGWDYRVRTISKDDVAAGAPISPPPGSVAPRDVGWFQSAGALLQPTPVRLDAYVDADSDQPVSKLLGVEVQDCDGFSYPEGFRNLLYIEHDARLGTASEHWQGMSFACPQPALARGDLNSGRIFGTNSG